jgi:outer membrane protein W
LRERTFWNAGAIHVNVKTKSGDTYDVDGPNGKVLTKGLIDRMTVPGAATAAGSGANLFYTYLLQKNQEFGTGLTNADVSQMATRIRGGAGIGLLKTTMTDLGIESLGTPSGIKGVAKPNMSTGGLSIGYYLDDEHTWAVETYVLAAPLSTSVSATGKPRYRVTTDADGNDVEVLQPFGLEGQQILTSKLLPPTILFGRYWGDANAKFRPYTGAVAMYAIFYDTKAEQSLNNYVGGTNPGDTSVSLKNAFGAGPMLGFRYALNDSWRVNVSVGHVKLKTEATLTTRNSRFTKNTPAVLDYGNEAAGVTNASGGLVNIPGVINTGEGSFSAPSAGGTQLSEAQAALMSKVGGLTSLVTQVAQGLTGNTSATYVRKAETTLSNTIYMLSIGRDF